MIRQMTVPHGYFHFHKMILVPSLLDKHCTPCCSCFMLTTLTHAALKCISRKCYFWGLFPCDPIRKDILLSHLYQKISLTCSWKNKMKLCILFSIELHTHWSSINSAALFQRICLLEKTQKYPTSEYTDETTTDHVLLLDTCLGSWHLYQLTPHARQ